jgi:hypothetical protein
MHNIQNQQFRMLPIIVILLGVEVLQNTFKRHDQIFTILIFFSPDHNFLEIYPVNQTNWTFMKIFFIIE